MSKVNMGKVSTAHPTSLPTLHLLHLYLGWWAVLNNNVKGEYGEGKHCPPYISTRSLHQIKRNRTKFSIIRLILGWAVLDTDKIS
ncbi:MAG: hypothetical protein F6J98_05490 [Moorea sp. SIO4G2]|uniref:hypothetical protein n=1 Tax=unclassified Moorena TaxID=2683338 RepID=UPI0013F765CE|nr:MULTISPECIES: hypothetical protein [unclassified Moorena]NEO15345.1 hypothetical protein [Moorena sp. SIO3E8]NEO59894.1 hypothetical protein [Moorena sp. SIO4G2]NEQ03337.1 hypothetical protein [Moorena sp. SIO3F7]